MRISLIRISNILGITDLELTPGRFNQIEGANGVNKTSVLNAIKSVVEGGHDATLLRNGAERGEVVLLLDDGLELRKTITAKSSRVEVKRGDVVMKRPQETIAALADLFSVNPIAFLSASKADRARVLLESMPITLDHARLARIAGAALPEEWHAGVHAMAAIDTIRKGIYDQRTACNVVLKEKKSTVEQLRQAMPEAPPDMELNEDEIEAELARIEAVCDEDLATLEGKVAGWMEAKDGRVATLTEEYNAALAAVREQMAALTAAHHQTLSDIQAQTSGAKDRAVQRSGEIRHVRAQARAPLTERLGVMRANRGATAKREQTLATIALLSEQIKVSEAESTERTQALDAIDAYKKELLADLPIADVEVVNGEIFRRGVPFDRLNTAQRISIAVDLARLRAGKLGIVCIDGAEALDPATMDAFKHATAKSDLQFFVTKVTAGSLRISNESTLQEA